MVYTLKVTTCFNQDASSQKINAVDGYFARRISANNHRHNIYGVVMKLALYLAFIGFLPICAFLYFKWKVAKNRHNVYTKQELYIAGEDSMSHQTENPSHFPIYNLNRQPPKDRVK